MNIVLFCHSLLSCWNHGNAHFLRGVTTELIAQGHHVRVFEPENSWSFANLLREQNKDVLPDFRRAYPLLPPPTRYDAKTLDLSEALRDADLVLVHEWNDPILVAAIGQHKARGARFRLLFHDTHHRAVTAARDMAAYDLRHYDGVLAFGDVIRDLYKERCWTKQAWTWHEAADTRLFHPYPDAPQEGDLVWVGNWGDNERTQELHEFLLGPVKKLGLRAVVYGVRYPPEALQALHNAGIEYRGWLPNHDVPRVFARFRVTVHVPRRPYVAALPGVPTIRPFEALACGIPLVSAPWNDSENLFTPGDDFLTASSGEAMTAHLSHLLSRPDEAAQMARRGRETLLSRHTCAHRAGELMVIAQALGLQP